MAAASARTAQQAAARRIAAVQTAVGTLALLQQQFATIEGLNERCSAAALDAIGVRRGRAKSRSFSAVAHKARLTVPLFEDLKTAVRVHACDPDPVTQARRASDTLASSLARTQERVGGMAGGA